MNIHILRLFFFHVLYFFFLGLCINQEYNTFCSIFYNRFKATLLELNMILLFF